MFQTHLITDHTSVGSPHNLCKYKSDSDTTIPAGSDSAPRGFVGTYICKSIKFPIRLDNRFSNYLHKRYSCKRKVNITYSGKLNEIHSGNTPYSHCKRENY